jgi:hypothetical protein
MPRKRGREEANANRARYPADVGNEMNHEDLMYLCSALLAVGLWACGVVALWATVEAGYWIYCKARGIKY